MLPKKATVWKFPLEIADWQKIVMPAGAEILFVGVQREQLCLWAKVNPEAPKGERLFRIVGTGHEFNENNLMYLGSVFLNNGRLVFHIFEG